MTGTRSLVLKPVADEDALFQEVEKCVKDWHQRYDLFLLHDDTTEDKESGVTTAFWTDPARPGFEFRLVGDEAVPMIYVTIIPDERTDVDQLAQEVAKCFALFRPDELKPYAIADPKDVHAWTRYAIALNGQHDDQAEAILIASLAESNFERLAAAAMAASLLCWPRLIESVRAAVARPIPDEVRSSLELALRTCESRQHDQ